VVGKLKYVIRKVPSKVLSFFIFIKNEIMEIKPIIYEMTIANESDGIFGISLVDEPAVQSYFVKFNEEKQVELRKIDGIQHNVLGVVLRPDFPIYRKGGYYIRYSKDVIRLMAQKMLADTTYKNTSVMHDGKFQSGVTLEQLFIKDKSLGNDPKGFEDIEEGTLFAVYHIEDEDIWNKIENGTFNGFSLEGKFTVEEEKIIKQNKEIMNLSKIKEAIKNLVVTFASVDTKEEITLYFDGELVEGTEVYDEFGSPIADGTYHTEDTEIKIEGGKVLTVTKIEVEEEPKEETEELEKNGETEAEGMTELETETVTVEETPTEEKPIEEEPKEDNRIEEMENKIGEMENKIEELFKSIADIKEVLSKPVVTSVTEELIST
jgi:hypothetical protein